MKKVCFVALISLFSSAIIANGNNEDTTLNNEVYQLQYSFEDNLDSMLNLWYVQNCPSLTDDLLSDTASFLNESYSYIPDSVYIKRLSLIPTTVKLTYNDVVRKYIEMYSQRKKGQIRVMLGMADYYFPMFDEVFNSYGIPTELKYMSIIESSLNPRARSRTKAIGLWQFMYGTGRRYGLTINTLVDERRDAIKETHAAAQFSRDLYAMYGDWQLVVAAYNCGPGNVNKAIRRSGGKRDFWEIYRYLPRETRGHVPAFIAAIYTLNYYKEHNIEPIPSSFPLYTDTIMVNKDLHLMQVAEVLNISIRQLRDLNPQYIHDIIPARGGLSYPLTLPVEATSRFIDLEDSIFAYKDSIYFNPKLLLKSPDTYAKHRSKYKPSSKQGKLIYEVAAGDNIGAIAMQYGVKADDIRDWNGIDGNTIRVGQKITIYTSKNAIPKNKEVAAIEPVKKESKVKLEVKKKESTKPDDSYVFYTVRNGDTLWEIAKKYPGTSQKDILKWNNLAANTPIKPGQVIKIKSVY